MEAQPMKETLTRSRKEQTNSSKHNSNSTSFNSSGRAANSADFSTANGTDAKSPKHDGHFATAKELYEGPRDKDGFRTWLDDPPEEIAEIAARKSQRKAHPLVLRYIKYLDHSGDRVFTLDSLVIQSELLKIAVRNILDDYPGANQCGLYTDEPTFEPPFQPFFHRWDKLEKYLASGQSNKDVELLYSILDAELRPIRNEVRSLNKHGFITFNLLWTLYPPGTVIFGRIRDQDHVFIAKRTRKRQLPQGGPLVLDVIVGGIDWDGVKYGQCVETITVMEFNGEKRIDDLEAFPTKYHPDEEGLMRRLSRRGELYSTLVQGGYKSYNGLLYPAKSSDPRYVESRMIIDCLGYIKHNPYLCRPLEPLSGRLQFPEKSSAEDRLSSSTQTLSPPPEQINTALPQESSAGVEPSIPSAVGTTGPIVPQLSPEQKPFCRSTIRGFSLSIKKWAEFEVDKVEEISWNDDAFAKLVMAPARKRLIRAVVKEQSLAKAQFDDVISGKGLGLIMLLSGPPGTGKTLTAESIADALRLPFYILSATELGDDIQQIEKSLQDVFQLTAGWNAVMLLDEADAFLEKRTDEMSAEGSKRNKRVAAFLRLLEYYKGTLILTTNRPITFDEAFASRIHLTLRFRTLDTSTRKAIWANFLTSSEGAPSDTHLDTLSQIDMNGREIKNVVKMAKLLAKNEGQSLMFEHIKDVMEVIEVPIGGAQQDV